MSKLPSDYTQEELIEMGQREIDKRGGLESVPCDIICLDGHRFHVNYDVPQHITDQIEALFWGDKEVRYEDIPEDVKAYEEKDYESDEKDENLKESDMDAKEEKQLSKEDSRKK
ncbi:Ff.00g066210.m01.CDS01 [Fusarium sp. VM40]|nr:Ff.00g066210.m01.CDS01 [Fusarium sp. VM40]